MSRVDEAMRRAAEQSAGEAAADAPPAPAPAVTEFAEDVAELSRESFPIEMPERRRPRMLSTPFPRAAAAEPTKATVPAPAPQPVSLIQRIDSSLARKVVIDDRILPASREQYRRLAASLHHSSFAANLKVIMVASAAPGEGKTLTSSNLALTFSESYQRSVLLIDGDLRKPALHTVFGIDNASGLSDGLAVVEERQLRVRQVSQRLAILPAGPGSNDPMAGLTSERMRRLLDEARGLFDWVIIDTPPVAFLADANLLTAMVDGAVLVVKAGSTPYDLVERAIAAIGRERIAGVVLNRAIASAHSSEYSYYDSYYSGMVAHRDTP